MNRRQALGGIAAVAGGMAQIRSAHAAIEFISEGFGLALDDFIEIWGEGEVGQTYLQYEEDDGTWFVGRNEDDFVTYIERFWNEGSEADFDDAVEEALAIIPEESSLRQTYQAPYGAILHGIQVDRYESSSLADQLGVGRASDEEFLAYTSFAIIYDLVPHAEEFGFAVRRFTIIHESRHDAERG
ncbi:MAG: hypothetical protein M3Y37_02485 [Chloroflexota bacterium]|nr:hypothetical protein [Chloroflexota bacterium]